METIGQRLKRLRLELSLSQRDLACKGVSYAYISRIEAGTREPSVKALRKLADGLGCSVTYLETGTDAIEVAIDVAAVDAHAARHGTELRWADLRPDEKQQITEGLQRALAARIGDVVYATSINRQLEEDACATTTARHRSGRARAGSSPTSRSS